ncbi:hypothetical protein PQX77_021664 [Marasmius sp. AFHP31]|nr:hypothetical protein PQX77_021664 [Marasmius sp. AFHP31]
MGDPHERRIEELNHSDEDEDEYFCLGSHLTSPSLFSHVDAPLDPEDKPQVGPSVTARWAKRLGLQTNTNAETASQSKGEAGLVKTERETDNLDGWDLVEPERT